MTNHPRSRWSLSVVTPEQAETNIRESANAFYVLAGLQALLSFAIGAAAIWDALLFAVLALWLKRRRSAVAAVLLLLDSCYGVYATALNQFGGGSGGKNVVLSIIMVWIALRATMAATKLPRLLRARAELSPAS